MSLLSEFKDRISRYPGRRLITPVDGGAPFLADVARADDPEEEGTPINKELFNELLSLKPKSLVATILTSGTFRPADYGLPIGTVVDVYMTGAGGGGVRASSGDILGGGGGYCKLLRNITLTEAAYTIVVGAGGAGTAPNASDGGSTTAFGVTMLGGKGPITSPTPYKGGDGGSGGGSGVSTMPGHGGWGGGDGFGRVDAKGGGNINYDPFNPYDGIFYGCGGGGGGGGSYGGGKGGGANGNPAGRGGGGNVTDAVGGAGGLGGGGGGGGGTAGGKGGDGLVLIYAVVA